ncbi:MAG: hypothetical protein JWR16_3095 [Nevskia sp.]|nr:hypothetical protein [Nevskia sp.]
MADIINLNKARKRKARIEAETQAAENCVRFGRSKQQRVREQATIDEAQRRLDQLKREPEKED